ncbi:MULTISPECIES: aldehyde dehydrogenase family protein [Actinoalloteichus]|uniref:aldehyde dehydrogenase family protein n=1 Tax=Actinoalloteichus TaxID=65496 RepID=UPI000AF4FB22|nr:aldehyde dehydrogenase family protein [Actinoalloteichus caeruleus]
MELPASVANFVAGQPTGVEGTERTTLVDPSSGTEFGSAPISRWNDVDTAMRRAENAHTGWAATTPHERQRALLRWADLVEGAADEFVAAECANTGKPARQVAERELPLAVEHIRFFAGASRVLDGVAAGEYQRGHSSLLRSEPLGVCAHMMPHSHPMFLAAAGVAPALAAGNAVVLKPAETTPLTSVMLAERAAEALPPGVLNVICGDRDTGRAMVAHEVPRLVSLTGAVRSGMEVAGSAAADLKRVHLRLGGKAPALVFGDVDVPLVAGELARAAFANAGQDCLAAARVLVADEVYDELVAAFVHEVRGLRVGPPSDRDAFYGPLNNENQVEQVEGVLDRLPEHATILTGGVRSDQPGYFFEPTVIAGVDQDDETVQNEIFGPVVTLQRFTDVDQAVGWANGVRYGGAASVWTRDHARAVRLSGLLSFGCVWINNHGSVVAEMPQSGFRHSGHGTGISRHGLDDYTRFKHVMSRL